MQKTYEKLALKVVEFTEDVITTSGPKVDVGSWGEFDSPEN